MEPVTQEPPPRPRMSAAEAFKSYGIRSAIFLALTIWFAYDGWFNPNIESKTFNKFGAVVLAAIFIFHIVMASSAGMTLRRQRKQPPPPSS